MSLAFEHLAIFVDIENIGVPHVGNILADLHAKSKDMTVVIVGNKQLLDSYYSLELLAKYDVQLCPSDAYCGKDSSDILLAIKLAAFVYKFPHIKSYAIVSGDAGFCHAVIFLKSQKKAVLAVSHTASLSSSLKAICDEYIVIPDIPKDKTLIYLELIKYLKSVVEDHCDNTGGILLGTLGTFINRSQLRQRFDICTSVKLKTIFLQYSNDFELTELTRGIFLVKVKF